MQCYSKNLRLPYFSKYKARESDQGSCPLPTQIQLGTRASILSPPGPVSEGPELLCLGVFWRTASRVVDATAMPSRQVCRREARTGEHRLRKALGSLWHRFQGRREILPWVPSSHTSQKFKNRGQELEVGAVHLNPAV